MNQTHWKELYHCERVLERSSVWTMMMDNNGFFSGGWCVQSNMRFSSVWGISCVWHVRIFQWFHLFLIFNCNISKQSQKHDLRLSINSTVTMRRLDGITWQECNVRDAVDYQLTQQPPPPPSVLHSNKLSSCAAWRSTVEFFFFFLIISF